MTDTRSSSALFKRAEQLKRWEASDTNKQSAQPKRASRIQFSSGIVFLAACTAGDKDEVQRLLKMGADINTANVDGLTALHQACIDDNLDMVEFLVTHGADVNRGDNEGWTALHATASCGFLSIARYLLENGADVGAVNYDGELPIDIAESDAMEDLLQKAIDEKGVDCEKSRNAEVDTLLADANNWAANGYVEVRDPKTGGTPLHVAAAKGYLDVSTGVIEGLVEVRDPKTGGTPLHVAAAKGYLDVSTGVIEGLVEVRDPKTGGTPLHVAAAKGYLDVAKTLLEECGVEPDCVDYEGWTPLHAAALWGQKEACALLLQHGADPHTTNYSGQTCMDLVDPSIAAWLSEAALKASPRRVNNNNNNKRRRSPPRQLPPQSPAQRDMKRVELQITGQDTVINAQPAEIVSKAAEKPPKGRAPSPDGAEAEAADEAPSWRRSASFRNRQEPSRDSSKPTNHTPTTDSDTILRRTHSFENDKTFYQRYRDVTARIKASSCPSIPPPPPVTASPAPAPAAPADPAVALPHSTDRVLPERREREREREKEREGSTTTTNTTATSPSHATVRSAEGAGPAPATPTAAGDSASNSSNSTPSAATPTKLSPGNIFKNFFKSFVPPVRDEESETQRKAHAKRVRETRRSTQGVTLDEIKSAEQLVKKKTGNGTVEPPASPAPLTPPAATPATPSPGKKDDSGTNDHSFELEDASAKSGASPTPAGNSASAEATVTVPLRRPPSGAAPPASPASPAATPPTTNKDDARTGDDERESSTESKSSSASPASTQAALNVIQRRRRPKRRSTGVGRVDMDDIANERGGADGADGGDADGEAPAQPQVRPA
ncbi:hypothetical protein O0L34_g2420 [Tuta absoluta]|nr:hypothetical protein O0L34_g2420 [Tuta absoluta]